MILQLRIVTSTAILASLCFKASGLQTFVGVGTVQCPEQDITEGAPCEFSFTNSVVQCLLSCPDAASFALNSFLDLEGDAVLPCDCTQAVNCPDSCTFTAEDNENSTNNDDGSNTTTIIGDYVGPGFLECESFSDFASCDISFIEDCTFDPSTCGVPDFSTIFDVIATGRLTVPLLCNCVQATDCSCSFTATEIETNTTSFEGPGTIVCPVEDYTIEPCYPLDTAGLCADTPECREFDVSPFIFSDDFGEIHIPLPCDCLKVAGCAPTCTFLDEVASANRETFDGAGRLTCPLSDYFLSPCVPIVNDSCEGTGFECIALALGTINVTDSAVTIDVPCDCVSLPDCSSGCTFEPMPEMMLRVNATGPGSLLCPAIDYAFSPCSFEATDEDCECEPTDFLSDSVVDFAVSLPCDCAVATGCPRSCEFTTEILSNNERVADFSGPGFVRCPREEYTKTPCFVDFLNIFDCLGDPGDCLVGALNPESIANITDGDVVTLALPCSCMELSGCPETCTFSETEDNSSPTAGMPTVTTSAPAGLQTMVTPAPIIAPTLSPVQGGPNPNPTDSLTIPSVPSAAPVVSEPTVQQQQMTDAPVDGRASDSSASSFATSSIVIMALAGLVI